MRRLAAVVGALLGFALGIVLVEVVFANGASWPDVVPFALAALGWLVGRGVGPRPDPPAREPSSSR
jgi:hypothetical protein